MFEGEQWEEANSLSPDLSGVKPGSGLLTDDDQAVTISRVDIVTIAVNLNGEEAES
jgi:hypothetical protein